jgi:hypothetical protein
MIENDIWFEIIGGGTPQMATSNQQGPKVEPYSLSFVYV